MLIHYWPQSDIRVKSYGRLNLLGAFVFCFECLDILRATIEHAYQKLWLFEFARGFRVQFRVSRYIMGHNRKSV